MSEHIVILGGGFAGWYAARALAPRLRSGHHITLIDRVDHMLYTPMLTEVAGGTLAPPSIAVPMKGLSKRIRFIKGDVQGVDPSSMTITLAGGKVLHATQVVFALGSTTSYHGIEGAKDHSTPLKTLEDAKRILARVDDRILRASTCSDPVRRRDLLTLIVAGGGYTGVETIAAVSEYLRKRVKSAGLQRDEVQTILIEPTERLMHETPASLARYSQDLLERQGVRVLLQTSVQSVSGDSVLLSTGERIHGGLLIWDAGIEPSPLVRSLSLPLGQHHGIEVDACLRVKGLERVWAVGDCAEIPQADGKTYAPTAQNATREGLHLARNIAASLRGVTPRPFHFTMLGQLALLSDRKAVAEILGVKVWGSLAWCLWWAIYIGKLPAARKRLEVVKQLIA